MCSVRSCARRRSSAMGGVTLLQKRCKSWTCLIKALFSHYLRAIYKETFWSGIGWLHFHNLIFPRCYLKTILTGNLIEFAGAESGPKPCAGESYQAECNQYIWTWIYLSQIFFSRISDSGLGQLNFWLKKTTLQKFLEVVISQERGQAEVILVSNRQGCSWKTKRSRTKIWNLAREKPHMERLSVKAVIRCRSVEWQVFQSSVGFNKAAQHLHD